MVIYLCEPQLPKFTRKGVGIMPSQIGKVRIYGCKEEATSPALVTCVKCKVQAVPRGISSSRRTAKGEKCCPNCGHVHGRVKGS